MGSNLTEQQALNVGRAIAEFLPLKKKGGFFVTSWGGKSLVGLGHSISRIVNEEVSNAIVPEVSGVDNDQQE